MGFLADAYKWVDANLLGGALPGGHEITAPGATIGGVIPTPFVGIQPAAEIAAPVAGGGFFGGAASQAAMGMPTSAAVASAPRGKLVTAVARVMPNGAIVPVRMMPGRSLVTSADLATVKRVKKTKRLLDRAFPAPRKKSRARRSYRAPCKPKK